jgi:hypothetical protein
VLRVAHIRNAAAADRTMIAMRKPVAATSDSDAIARETLIFEPYRR